MTVAQTTLEDAGVDLGPRKINRPDIGYSDAKHAYTLDGEPVPGVSTVAKMGTDGFTPGGWWGWGIALEGVADAGEDLAGAGVAELRSTLRARGFDPNQRRDAAGDRGTAVHDALEALAQEGRVPRPGDYPAAERGHVLSLLKWFTHYRPEFEATEVIVGSREHGFAGRYDLRVRIRGMGLGLVDLKTSKAVYPEQHFAQLGGYELASREMGFEPTDFQAVLRTSEDGTFIPWDEARATAWAGNRQRREPGMNFVPAWGDPCGLFLGYLEAYRARAACWDMDPRKVAKREAERARALQDASVVDRLGASHHENGATARVLADELGMDAKRVSASLQRLKRDGRVACEGRTWSVA